MKRHLLIPVLTLLAIYLSGFNESFARQSSLYPPPVDTSEYIPGDLEFNLLVAADKGYLNEVKRLIKEGANVNAQSYEGVTALMYASQQGHLEIVKTLLNKQAEPDIKPNQGLGALSTSVVLNHLDIAEELLRHDADIEIKTNDGVTPLMLAVAENLYYMTDMLLYYGADTEARDKNGNTAMMVSVLNNNLDITKLLYDHGAEINASDEKGFTPLIIAAQEGHAEIASYLLSMGADYRIMTEKGVSPLMSAIYHNNPEIVKLLINEGANPKQKLRNGKTAYSIAAQSNNQQIKKILLENGASKDRQFSLSLLSIGIDQRFNSTEYMSGFTFSAEEMKTALFMETGFYFRPFYKRVVVDNFRHDKMYQFWEKRYNVPVKLGKRFKLYKSYNKEIGISLSAKAIMPFGKYRGTDKRPDIKFFPGPELAFFYKKNNHQITAAYDYIDFDVPQLNNHYFSLKYSFSFNIGKTKIKHKDINWLR